MHSCAGECVSRHAILTQSGTRSKCIVQCWVLEGVTVCCNVDITRDKGHCNLSDKYALACWGYQPLVFMPDCTPFASDISWLTSSPKTFPLTYVCPLLVCLHQWCVYNLVYFTFHVCIVLCIHWSLHSNTYLFCGRIWATGVPVIACVWLCIDYGLCGCVRSCS